MTKVNKNEVRSVVVYCASSSRIARDYIDEAAHLGTLLAQHGIRLVNGAGHMGLMGATTDAALRAGGEVTGVIPRFMVEQGWAHPGLTDLRVVESMHERKRLMAELSDAVIALPGGCGTLEELLEAITWRQLGLNNRPIILLNTAGYYNPLLAMFDQAAREGFMAKRGVEAKQQIWQVAETAEEAITMLCSSSMP